MSDLALKLIAENKKARSKSLDLGNCGLTGIPEELGEMVWLDELSFASSWSEFDGNEWLSHQSNNMGPANKISSLSSSLPVFKGLTNLKKLYLNGQKDNILEFDDLGPVAELTNLQQLNISYTQVADLSLLSHLIQLQVLDISRTLVKSLDPLSSFTNLQELEVSSTKVSDLNPLAYLTSLKQLFIYSTRVSDLRPIIRLTGLEQLHVFDTEVDDLSPLTGITKLQKLDVSFSLVSDLTPLTSLNELKLIDVSKTQVNDLSSLVNLTGLQILDISNTSVNDLSPLNRLSNLQSLNISSTNVTDLSPLMSLTYIQRLDISDTRVNDLSPLSDFVCLKKFNASRTKIKDLNPFRSFNSLEFLDLSLTEVSDISPLSELIGLKQLDLSITNVSDLNPIKMLIKSGIDVNWNSDSLSSSGIYVDDCPLTNPPAEIVKQGNNAILNYFRDKETQGVDHLYEAKMLIIGEGGAGKTSLLRRLYQTDKPLPNEKESTKGIDIYRHNFRFRNGRDFRLNVWDFGGQEIYHATHQFFLTKRSLYVLLDDTRKDYKSVHDSGFKYWLEAVDLLGGHSPVLIFQNEKSGRPKKIDKRGIKGKFDNVKGFYKGNLENRDATDKLRNAIEFYVDELPHIGEELPAKWVSIRTDIDKLAQHKPYITQEEYFDIYKNYLEFDTKRALSLSDYLHDLGVFLHFQDDPLLSRTVILQNRWATEAVFKILDDETIIENMGQFNSADYRRLWEDSEYLHMHLELLTLMQKFELCYQLRDQPTETWLAPQLLSPSKPNELKCWASPDDLVLRYRYEFLPKGIISRLIVRKNRYIKRPKMSWNTGALFENDSGKVLAEVTDNGNEITLCARGPDRKGLLSIISADLDALNDTFHGLSAQVKKLVPCNCSKCSKQNEPQFYEQKMLLHRKKNHKLQFECNSSLESVNALELLDGISVDELEFNKNKDKLVSYVPGVEKHTIKIFLASSSELKDDRDDFELYFRQQNDHYHKLGIGLKIIRWENFLDAMSETRLQDKYNKAIKDCDLFVSLFFTKTGKFTEEEFDTAHKQFKETQKPLIYTFFKNAPVNTSQIDGEIMSLLQFKEKLSDLGHFYTGYDNIEHLKRQFRDQLDKLFDQGR